MVDSMNMENQPLVTNEPVGVQGFKKITDYFIGIYGIYSNLIKKPKMHWLDLGTLGSQLINMLKNLSGQWFDWCVVW